jgi:O-succinylbenzoic acid--CoA ligase
LKPATPYIILNSQIITPELVGAKLETQLPEWEKKLFLFLNEWFSDSDFVLAQTSGSTGKPKPIELPKSIMIRSAERTIEYFGLKPENRILLSLPCRYIAGKMMVVRAIVGQMNLIPVDPSTDFDFLQNEAFDFGAMVPNQVVKLLGHDSGMEKLQNISNLLIGGSGISEKLEAQVASSGSTGSPPSCVCTTLAGSTSTRSRLCCPEVDPRARTAPRLGSLDPESSPRMEYPAP